MAAINAGPPKTTVATTGQTRTKPVLADMILRRGVGQRQGQRRNIGGHAANDRSVIVETEH